MQEELSALSQFYESVQTSVSRKIDAVCTNKTKLHHFLIQIYPPNTIPNPIIDEIKAASNTQNLFRILTQHGMWSYVNYHLLECIVSEYIPHDDEVQKQLQHYIGQFKVFAQTASIQVYIDACKMFSAASLLDQGNETPVCMHMPDPALFSCLKIKIQVAAPKQLIHLLKLRSHLMKQLYLPHPTLLLGKIGRGSVVIKWYFPAVAVGRILTSASSCSDFFREHNIVQVNINDQLVYEDAVTAGTQQQVERQ